MNPEKTLAVLEKLAKVVNRQLFVSIDKSTQGWLITFIAGEVRVRASIETFLRSPMIVVNAMEDELIKSEIA